MADAPAEPVRPALDESNLKLAYANYGRVTSTPEEVILDFGLNANAPNAADPKPVAMTERIVLNHYTAKRVAMALQMAVQRHEKTFGSLELDVSKRVVADAEAKPS